MLSVVVGLVLVGRDVPNSGMEALVVEPVDPFCGAELDVGQAVPGPAGLDQLRFEQADLGLHECVVQGVADGANRGGDAGLEQVGGEREGRVLTVRVLVMNEPGTCWNASPVAAPQGHVECVEDEPGPLAGRGRPADDRSGEHVHDEGDVDDAGPGGDVGEVGNDRSFGRDAVKSRLSRSQARSWPSSGMVVRIFFPRRAPSRPRSRISRATVQRATGMPSRCSCRQTFRTP